MGLDVDDRRIGVAVSDELGVTAQGLLQKTERFMQVLEQVCQIPCIRWDERLTTLQAERLLIAAGQRRRKRKAVRDKIAAPLILQNYLEYQRAHVLPPTS